MNITEFRYLISIGIDFFLKIFDIYLSFTFD